MDIHRFNQNVRRGLMANWVYNAAENRHLIADEFRSGKDLDLRGLGTLSSPQPAIVVGSGPSLDQIAPMLPMWKGAIFCSPSHVHILDAVHRHPEYLVAIDSSSDVAQKMSGVEYYKTLLITHPSIDPQVLTAWGNRQKRYFLMKENGEWSDTLPIAYPWIESRIPNFGCVANTCIFIAHSLGYSPIFLAGVEFAFNDGVESFSRPNRIGSNWYKPEEPKKVDASKPWFTTENGVITSNTNIFYKSVFMANWKMFGMKLVTMAPGILKEVPYADPETVIKAQGQMDPDQPYLSQERIAEMVDAYTIPHGMYAHAENGQAGGLEMASLMVEQAKQTSELFKIQHKAAKRWKELPDGSWERKEL